MPNNKSIDGIKKLNIDNLGEARNIVLRSIGEDKKNTKVSMPNKKNAVANMKVDGVLAIGDKRDKDFTKTLIIESKKKKAEQMKISKEEKDILLNELEKSKQISKKKDSIIIEKNKIENKKETFKENNKKLNKEMAKRKKIEDKERIKKQKKKQENDQKKEREKLVSKKLSREKWERRKIIIKQKIKKITFALKRFFINQTFLYSFLFILIASYISFCVVLCGLNLDNNTTRMIAKHIPVPAVITEIGVIEYYDYKDMEYLLSNNQELILDKKELTIAAKKELIKALIINRLIKKYNIQASDQQLIIDEIKNQVITDQEINSEALSKLIGFKLKVEAGQDFYEVAKNYINDFSAGKYYSNSEAIALFGRDIINLELGQMSDVIVDGYGYYIAQCYDKKDNLVGLKYVFVKSKSLEEHIDEVTKNLKMISFIYYGY